MIYNISINNIFIKYISEHWENKKIIYNLWKYKLRCNNYIIYLIIWVFFEKYLDIEKQINKAIKWWVGLLI